MNNKKFLIVILNILTIAILLWRVTENLSIINQVELNTTKHVELLIKAGLLKQSEIDMNLMCGITVGLFFMNLLLFRFWIKSRRWILTPILIFILSLGLSFTYYINMTKTIGEELEETELNNITIDISF